jgi:hypothetical protein
MPSPEPLPSPTGKLRKAFTLPKPSEDLQALYERLPALNQLVECHYWLGLFRGLVEMAVSTRLYMNLPEIGILSMLTGYSFNTPGEYLAEIDATRFISAQVDPKTPSHQVKALKAETVQFIGTIWETREDLETLLKEEHFKTPAQFETNYLQKVEKVNGILKRGLSPDEQARELATLLFGEKKINPEEHPDLMELLRNQKLLMPEAIEQALRDFYGKISGLANPSSAKDKLWTRGRYTDLTKGLSEVVEHGYYEAMDEELQMLKGAENALKDVKAKRKLSRDDIEDLDTLTREYLAFLMTNQWHFHEGEESLSMVSKALDSIKKKQKLDASSKQHLKTLIDALVETHQLAKRMYGANGPESQQKLALAKAFIADCVEGNVDPEPTIKILQDFVASLNEVYSVQGKSTWEQKIKGLKGILASIPKGRLDPSPIFDEMGQYIDSRRRAMKAAGVSEKKVYLSLATARERFLDTPVQQFTREINREELDRIMDLCFGQSKKSKRNEILSHAALYGMLGVSVLDPGLFGGKIASALGWGLPIGSRTFFESYNVVKGARVMSNAVAQIFVNGFGDKKANVAALINEHDSRSSQAYNRGYFQAMVGSLGTGYGGEIMGLPLLGYLPVLASFLPFAMAYRKWFKSVAELKTQIYKNIRAPKGPTLTNPEMPAVQLPSKPTKPAAKTLSPSSPETPSLQAPPKSNK